MKATRYQLRGGLAPVQRGPGRQRDEAEHDTAPMAKHEARERTHGPSRDERRILDRCTPCTFRADAAGPSARTWQLAAAARDPLACATKARCFIVMVAASCCGLPAGFSDRASALA